MSEPSQFNWPLLPHEELFSQHPCKLGKVKGILAITGSRLLFSNILKDLIQMWNINLELDDFYEVISPSSLRIVCTQSTATSSSSSASSIIFEFEGFQPRLSRSTGIESLNKVKSLYLLRKRQAEYLSRHPDIFSMYKELVPNVLLPSEFWESHTSKMEEEYTMMNAKERKEISKELKLSLIDKNASIEKFIKEKKKRKAQVTIEGIWEDDEYESESSKARKDQLTSINIASFEKVADTTIDVINITEENEELVEPSIPVYSTLTRKKVPFVMKLSNIPLDALKHDLSLYQPMKTWDFDCKESEAAIMAMTNKIRQAKKQTGNNIIGSTPTSDLNIPQDLVDVLKAIETSANEFLRHFWSLFPITSANLEKGKVLDDALSKLAERIEMERNKLNEIGKPELTKLFVAVSDRIDHVSEAWSTSKSKLTVS